MSNNLNLIAQLKNMKTKFLLFQAKMPNQRKAEGIHTNWISFLQTGR